MAVKMNEKDKNTMLDQLLPAGENYEAKIWTVIEAGADALTSIGALSIVLKNSSNLGLGAAGVLGSLSNEYAYMGLTQKRLVVVVVKKNRCFTS